MVYLLQEERRAVPKFPPQKRAMEYRNWKNAPVRTSLLGYGCMRFPTTPEGRIDEPRAEALLNAARDAGVNYFDTAYPYHGGESEPFVGRVIAKWPRESFYLATKLPLWQCKSLDEAKRIFADQQKRLGVDYFDFYLMHSLHKARYDEAKALGIVDWLWEQKAVGTIRSLGFSCHDHSAGFEHILRDQPWDFCQLQYNYLDWASPSSSWSPSRAAPWPPCPRTPKPPSRPCARRPAPLPGHCAGWAATRMSMSSFPA